MSALKSQVANIRFLFYAIEPPSPHQTIERIQQTFDDASIRKRGFTLIEMLVVIAIAAINKGKGVAKAKKKGAKKKGSQRKRGKEKGVGDRKVNLT